MRIVVTLTARRSAETSTVTDEAKSATAGAASGASANDGDAGSGAAVSLLMRAAASGSGATAGALCAHVHAEAVVEASLSALAQVARDAHHGRRHLLALVVCVGVCACVRACASLRVYACECACDCAFALRRADTVCCQFPLCSSAASSNEHRQPPVLRKPWAAAMTRARRNRWRWWRSRCLPGVRALR